MNSSEAKSPVASDGQYRIEMADGHTVMARQFTPRDFIVLRDTIDPADWFEHLNKQIVSHSYDRDFLDWPIARSRRLGNLWQAGSRDDVLPPEQGES